MDKEILDGFVSESKQLLAELTSVVEKIEEVHSEFPTALLEEFSQKIDRIMGAAKTLSTLEASHLGLQRISSIAELCKVLGYKAAELKKIPLLPVFSAFWADTIEVVSELLENIEDEQKTLKITQQFSAIVQGRLEWLAKKINATRTDVAQKNVDALLSSAGTTAPLAKTDAATKGTNPETASAEIDIDALLKDLKI